jgi:hypothetical protein
MIFPSCRALGVIKESRRVNHDLHPANGVLPDFNSQALEKSLFALNIARHNASAYPAEHPAIAKSVDHVLELLSELLEFRQEITLGAARDRLLLDGTVLNEKNAVYRSLAGALFDAGISSLTLNSQVTREELSLFLRALRPSAARHENIFNTLEKACIKGVAARSFDFSALHATDMETIAAPAQDRQAPTGLTWESFTESLLADTLDPQGQELVDPGEVDPATLATLMSHIQDKNAGGKQPSYEETVISFLRRMDQEEIENESRKTFLEKLSAFIDKLAPDTRRQFLGSAFRFLGQRRAMTEQVLNRLSGETVLDILDDCHHEKIDVPPLVLDLLGKLSQCVVPQNDQRQVAAPVRLQDAAVSERIRDIFQHPESPGVISSSYQQLLQSLLATRPMYQRPPEGFEELFQGLESHQLEGRLCSIILEMMDADPYSEETAALEGNLKDLVEFFLKMEDFSALIETLRRLQRHVDSSDPFAFPLAKETLAHLAQPNILANILDGLSLENVERNAQIRELIRVIGAPFADPLLDRLSEEKNLSRRRLFMACLEDLGAAAQRSIVARLHDRRWYLVRNLVVLLRNSGDKQVLKPLAQLVGHAHPKVRFEVSKTFLHFGDQRAERYLIRELGSDDLDRQLHGVLLARSTQSGDITAKLCAVLNEPLSDKRTELKTRVIQTLAQNPSVEAGLGLAAFLLGKSLRHPFLHRHLREEILQAIRRHRPGWAIDILQEVAAASTSGTARQAGELLRELQETDHDA